MNSLLRCTKTTYAKLDTFLVTRPMKGVEVLNVSLDNYNNFEGNLRQKLFSQTETTTDIRNM